MAGDLRRRYALAEEGEWNRRFVARLRFQPRIVDGAAVEPSGRAGLEPAHAKTQRIKALAEPDRGRFANAPRRNARLAHVDHALQEGARGDDHGAAAKFAPARCDHTGDRAIFHDQVFDRLRDDFKAGLRGQSLLHMPAIELAVGLGARSLHGRPLGAVQHAKLDAGPVDDRPIKPSSASTSRTRCPLPRPPIAGLQDISPMVSNLCVTRAVRAPIRAAAAAASQPACPPPTTTTSKFFVLMLPFFSGLVRPAGSPAPFAAGAERTSRG